VHGTPARDSFRKIDKAQGLAGHPALRWPLSATESTMSTGYNDLHTSYGRCLRSRGFIERFYEILLASDPRIPPLFEKTDFQKQHMALRRGISLAISWAAGDGMAQRPVEEMIRVHARMGRAPVFPALHDHWLESLLQAVRERDDQLTPELEARWREAMGKVTHAFAAAF
jgi:hemoglobin-like flavoprotein